MTMGVAVLTCYFAFHALFDDKGLFALVSLKQELAATQQAHTDIVEERKSLERRVASMRSTSLDPDLLEEQSRQLLGYARQDEIVVLLDH